MPPHISILLPVANGAEFLFESLTSVLQQTYTHWECLVILNGPGLEGPAEAVATALEDPRIRILKVPVTNKVSALNAAVPHTTGDWIALLDVDDIWAPNKLAEQVAVIPLGPAVIGTLARYFGEFQGQPALPTGWVSPSQLARANPVINSSVLLRREFASWEYHSLYKDSMEDYYLWMKVALGVASDRRGAPSAYTGIYNVPQILVSHRVYSTSAFNSRREDPAVLVAWYQEKLAAEPVCTVITTACNNPGYIRAQHAAFSRYVKTPWRFVVFNDAKDWPDATNFGDPSMPQQIEATCRELGIPCVSVPNQAHRHMTSASHRHCDVLRYVMDFIRQAPPGRFWMWDSDMWPVAPYSAEDLKARFENATCVRQTRQDPTGASIVYAWPNLWWVDTTRTDVRDLCWDLAPHCDTGGASAHWVKSQTPTWLPPHRSSCCWDSTDLPTLPPSVLHFLAADPRNQGGKYWAELYDDRMFHVRAGSNWNGEGAAVHQQVAALVKASFA